MQDTNSLQDEIRVSRSQIRHLPFSKKAEYYWGYYKYHGLIILVLAIALGNIIHSTLTKKETMLSIAYINAFPNIEDEVFIEDFENYLGLNLKKQQVLLDSTYYIEDKSTSPYAATYSQKFSTNAMAGKLDVVLADTANFDFYGNQGFFQNLNDVLSPELLKKYKKHLYFVNLPDDNCDQAIPIGIKIDAAKKICETCSYPNTDAYFGFVTGSKYVDNALSYLNYLNN